ncbi:MAG: hypothetical protein EOP65_12555 [Sphingomonas sp.]|jgi:hypothetical protein|uniref:hypothetical protein n=1 Tax=Sphingomonas sp. CD22 TaxID=3100214 RepID=UPI00120AB514|nr:hypothetical protein [Sphingomonas sp. CD22]MEA1083820.1 hypothetical protein [Sphingomonas sp. CD22]RZL53676.1 MAG: hypothetical protein EOP65_12555 [Sphingomonas sp.]
MVGLSQARVAPIARLLFWAALLFALVMALSPRPPVTVDVLDKWQHMTAFGTLTVLACAGWPRAPLGRIAERLSFLGAMIELVQSVPVLHRDCDIMDWVADTAIIVGVVLVVAVARSGRPRRL